MRLKWTPLYQPARGTRSRCRRSRAPESATRVKARSGRLGRGVAILPLYFDPFETFAARCHRATGTWGPHVKIVVFYIKCSLFRNKTFRVGIVFFLFVVVLGTALRLVKIFDTSKFHTDIR